MLRTSSSSAVGGLADDLANRRRANLIRPSRVTEVEAQDFAESRPFERFGTWAAPIRVARDGSIRHLARWMALYHRQAAEPAELWQLCQRHNPQCFRQFQVVRLAQPSFFLPAGEVAFEVLTNPTQIPDRPPAGVMLRHLEAMDRFPDATFYFLRPVFVADPWPRLCLPAELRQEAHFDQHDALRAARWFGWAFRGQARVAELAERVAIVMLRAAARTVEFLNGRFAPMRPAGRAGRAIVRRSLPLSLEYRLERAESLGLEVDAQRLRWALEDLRRRIAVDPILCFELPERPGVLWFEAHWYDGIDGRTYVHF